MSDSLLPPNASTLARHLEQTARRGTDLPVNVDTLWNPDTCPAYLLPWLAWALSLDSWKPYWPEHIKRARIRAAIAIQRKKGTAQAVRNAVQSFGASLTLTEWHQTTPKGQPHTFEVLMVPSANAPNTADYQQDIINEINRVKPVRSHFSLIAGLSATGALGLLAAARPVVYARINSTEAS